MYTIRIISTLLCIKQLPLFVTVKEQEFRIWAYKPQGLLTIALQCTKTYKIVIFIILKDRND